MQSTLLTMESHEVPEITETEVLQSALELYQCEITLEEHLQAVEDAVGSIVSLETMAEDLLALVVDQDGGGAMTPLEQRLLEFSIDKIYNDGSILRPEELSMEKMADTPIKERLNGFKEHAARLLQMIIEAVKRAIEAVGDFIHRAISHASQIAIWARRLEMLAQTKEGQPKNRVYSNADIAQRLRLPANKSANLVANFHRVTELVFASVQVANGPIVSQIEHLLQMFKKGAITGVPDLAKVVEHTYAPAFAHIGHGLPYPEKNVDVPDDCIVAETNVLLGGYVGICILPQTNRALHHFDFKIIDAPELVETDTNDVDMVASTLPDIRQLLRMVNQVAVGITAFEKEQRKHQYMATELEALNHSIQNVTGDLNAVDKDILRCIGKIAPKIISGLHRPAFAYSLRISRAVLQHCKISLDQYEARK